MFTETIIYMQHCWKVRDWLNVGESAILGENSPKFPFKNFLFNIYSFLKSVIKMFQFLPIPLLFVFPCPLVYFKNNSKSPHMYRVVC